METNIFFIVFVAIYVVSLIVMYLYLVKNDKSTSTLPTNIAMNYAEETKKEKGKIGVMYYINHLSGFLAIVSIVIPISKNIIK